MNKPPTKENNLVMKSVMIFNQNKSVFIEDANRPGFTVHWNEGEWRALGWRERIAFWLLGWNKK